MNLKVHRDLAFENVLDGFDIRFHFCEMKDTSRSYRFVFIPCRSFDTEIVQMGSTDTHLISLCYLAVFGR